MTSKTRLFFTLTERERDALLALDVCRASWRTFGGQTWQALAGKGLVRFGIAPAPTDAGRAAIALTRALTALTHISLAEVVRAGPGQGIAPAPEQAART